MDQRARGVHRQRVNPQTETTENIEVLRAAAAGLLAGTGRAAASCAITPIPGGANNRVFRVRADGNDFLLKAYFHHPVDTRDRLGAEFAFSEYAWSLGLRCLPEPIARDTEKRLGLYEFIQGRALTRDDVGESAVRAALDFYLALNALRDLASAASLPEASEACFSFEAHLECVTRRLNRLTSADADPRASCLVCDIALPLWKQIEKHTRHACGNDCAREIHRALHRVSPSDFGFHNALLTDDGRIVFLDYEYAGWDDPAKTVCDFFHQPQIPVPGAYYDMFVSAVGADSGDAAAFRARVDLLMPVYGMKWVCILLNDFTAAGAARRRFSRGGDAAASDADQLEKARAALEALGAKLLKGD